ncbi:MAG TPA: glycosyltransferase family A protein [Candidatus Limnocylindrales bacterium]|nr:glycosyltransferase family A protein [Candidatus Limnocylindrales bacterium]
MQELSDISIIMPTYNRAYIIKNAIQSVLNQTHKNWELIVIDDGSTDGTDAVVKEIGDDRIVYDQQSNQGAAAARNHGLELARGNWVAYLDSDNELFPNYMERMLYWLDNNPEAVFAIPRAHRTQELYENGKLVRLIDDSEDTPPGLGIKDIFMKNLHLDTNGYIHLKRLFDEGIKWDPALHAMEDWDLAMTMGEKYPEGFLYVEEVLYNYHQRYGGDGVVSNSKYSDWAITFEQIYQKHKDDKMLVGQQWYPSRVEKWQRLQKEFEEGNQPPYHLYYFQS